MSARYLTKFGRDKDFRDWENEGTKIIEEKVEGLKLWMSNNRGTKSVIRPRLFKKEYFNRNHLLKIKASNKKYAYVVYELKQSSKQHIFTKQ